MIYEALTRLEGDIPPAWLSLGYRPFMEPLPLDRYWLLLMVPMVFAIAVVYKAVKLDDLRRLPQQALLLTLQFAALMAAAAALLWLITEIV